MDLSDEGDQISLPICVTFARSDKLIKNTHQRVQVHVSIDEV